VPRVGIVTDSAADLDRKEMIDRGVHLVDLDVRLGDAGPDTTRLWTAEEFWSSCASSSALPETAAPAPGQFIEAFRQAAESGADGIVCVTLSSRLSATYQSALSAAASYGAEMPVRVIDSLSVTMGEGLAVLAGAEAAEQGASLDEVEEQVRSVAGRVRVYGVLDTLENLRRGGRIGGAQALLGSLLAVKPVIEVRDGVVEPESRQRTRSRSLRYLAEKVAAAGPLERLAVVHAAAADVSEFVDMVSPLVQSEVTVTHIGPVIGAHAGPGSIGACLQTA
jgi:DegV family protein with EDD domain